MNMLIVKKFGGTSVADKDRIFNVAKRCIRDYEAGNDVVVVLSAMGKYTDELIAKAKDINPNPPKREMDMLFTIGEQMSVSLMAMAMVQLGVRAVSLNAFQVPMRTTSAYGNARLKKIDTERIRRELDDRKIVIVTGFQGVNKYDDYTTLGRGGSDTTAVALAAVLHADACEIYTDVDGVYTADPRLVPTARKLESISYDEMLDLAALGAGVLHSRSVELAKKYGVLIIEDNPYGDLRYSGEYVPNIKSFDTDGIVIYAGSFSKVISPGMRVAYTIAPKPIFQKLVVCKQGNDVHTNIWSQYVCDEFITKYDFNAHLAKLREIYTKKANFCMELLDKYCAPKITYHKIDGGLFIWCDLPEDIDMPNFCKELVLKKVCVVPGNAFLTDENETCHSFRINFSTPTDEQLERGIKILGEYANSL